MLTVEANLEAAPRSGYFKLSFSSQFPYSFFPHKTMSGEVANKILILLTRIDCAKSCNISTTLSRPLQRTSDGQAKTNPRLADENFEEDEDEHSETLCGTCGGNYNADEFWIGCDICERWYHGKCVKITPAKAESIKQYKCPSCMKRGRQQNQQLTKERILFFNYSGN